jgi:hypothetical protein
MGVSLEIQYIEKNISPKQFMSEKKENSYSNCSLKDYESSKKKQNKKNTIFEL